MLSPLIGQIILLIINKYVLCYCCLLIGIIARQPGSQPAASTAPPHSEIASFCMRRSKQLTRTERGSYEAENKNQIERTNL